MTTGAEVEDSAEAWWNWWNEHNERYEGYKPTSVTVSTESYQIGIASWGESASLKENRYDFGKMLIQYSCLVAGTPVQTVSGLQAIERIQIGDLVLAQNVETAELTLKPVLLTTVRPPKETIKIVMANESIRSYRRSLLVRQRSGVVEDP
ncbi:MAG: polymorphic toxin-type HINT domain-containing protein [Pirellulaceae bacterium]